MPHSRHKEATVSGTANISATEKHISSVHFLDKKPTSETKHPFHASSVFHIMPLKLYYQI